MLGLGSISVFVKMAFAALGVGILVERFASAVIPNFLEEPPETRQQRPSWSQRLRSWLHL